MLVVGIAGGCGRAETRKERKPLPADDESPPAIAAAPPAAAPSAVAASDAASQNAAPSAQPTAANPAPTTATVDDPTAPGPGKVSETAEPPAIKLNRPSDLAKWKPDDFRSAHADHDPKLLAAVKQCADNWPADEDTGKLLVELLEAELTAKAAESKTTAAKEPKKNGLKARPGWHIEMFQGEEVEVMDSGGNGGAAQSVQRSPPADAELDVALVQSLGVNGSGAAREALKQLLLGKFPASARDPALARAAIWTLCHNDSIENERLLYTVLTAPDKVRPSGRGLVTADELQQQCVAEFQDLASPRLRTDVAIHLAKQPLADDPLRARLVTMLRSADERNLEAHTVLWNAKSIDGSTKSSLLQNLAQRSREAMAGLLRQPADPAVMDSGTSRRAVDIAEAQRIAGILWQGHFVEAVENRLAVLADATSEPDLVSLAGNFPVTDVRTHFHDLLKSRWVEGTGNSATKKLLDESQLDPGFLLVVKSLPREDRPEKHDQDDKLRANEDAPQNRKAGRPAWEKAKKEREAKYAWMDACQKLVQEWNRRCAAAAAAPPETPPAANTLVSGDAPLTELAAADPFDNDAVKTNETSGGGQGRGQGTTQVPGTLPDSVKSATLPFNLHEGARVTAEFRLEWPAELPGELSSAAISPLSLRYLRVVVTDRFVKLRNYYGRRLHHDHLLKNGCWLESLYKDSETGELRSIDVMITRAAAEKTAADGDAERLVLDILALRIPDPTAD